jgi:hypothetical protein
VLRVLQREPEQKALSLPLKSPLVLLHGVNVVASQTIHGKEGSAEYNRTNGKAQGFVAVREIPAVVSRVNLLTFSPGG